MAGERARTEAATNSATLARPGALGGWRAGRLMFPLRAMLACLPGLLAGAAAPCLPCFLRCVWPGARAEPVDRMRHGPFLSALRMTRPLASSRIKKRPLHRPKPRHPRDCRIIPHCSTRRSLPIPARRCREHIYPIAFPCFLPSIPFTSPLPHRVHPLLSFPIQSLNTQPP